METLSSKSSRASPWMSAIVASSAPGFWNCNLPCDCSHVECQMEGHVLPHEHSYLSNQPAKGLKCFRKNGPKPRVKIGFNAK